jgi:putative N6-adenine-specific DNA methylase
MRETLAAALVKLSRPRENVRLWDPFCGSGTIPIEAALIMTNTAPGLNRSFAAEKYAFLPKKIWQSAREEAKAKITPDTEFRAFASDTDPEVLKIARANIKRAGMEKYIKTFVKDATEIASDDVRTTIVCNPPYGERLDTIKGARELYKKLGRNFPKLAPWQIYIITSEEDFEKPVEELSDDDLDTVAGGGDVSCACAMGGGGTKDSNDGTCACVLAGVGYDDTKKERCLCGFAGYGYDT